MSAQLKSKIPEVAHRSIGVIITSDGTSCRATATENLWVGVSPFSNPSEGNEVTALTTGKAYYSKLKQAIGAAQKSIYIAGWQVNWDAQLDEEGKRLFDVLLSSARNNTNLKIYVMPWDDSAPVQTFDDQTKSVLELINELVGRECVFVNLAKSMADADTAFFSHHQKQVVIDEKIGFVGGIDLAYGRFDDANYDLKADAHRRTALNRYNGCIYPVGTIDKKEVVDPDLLTGMVDRMNGNRKETITAIQKGAYQVPYKDDSATNPMALDAMYTTLDPAKQPRMPWQDVHVKIEGPAAADLALNFVLRWNTEGGSPQMEVPNSSIHLPDGNGSCTVQVLRSAPRNMCHAEYTHMQDEDQLRIKQPIEAQANIAEAMKILIEKAEHFIYIENQFFVSGFGDVDEEVPDTLSGPGAVVNKSSSGMMATRIMPGDSGRLPQNEICELLATRIHHLIMCDPGHPFHVYITLPVHPEGMLNSAAVITQVHWTMQSLVFGSHSLLNRIRRSLYGKTLGENWAKAFDIDDKGYESIKIEECEKYVTLLNLRNWAKLDNGNYVTEQIYIHSKMMIVDDRYALLGSANINDRSLMGGRDSELAVLISDNKTGEADLVGDGKKRPVRNFARQLRMDVWNKIFGMGDGECTARSATELSEAVKKPGAPASWKKIREVAQKNSELYEAAFDFIPRNEDAFKSVDNRGNIMPASIWPTHARDPSKNIDPRTMKATIATMPFDKDFWSQSRFNTNEAIKLEGVKGFTTLLPIEWTKKENNNMKFHTGLMVKNESNKKIPPNQQLEEQTASNDRNSNRSEGNA